MHDLKEVFNLDAIESQIVPPDEHFAYVS